MQAEAPARKACRQAPSQVEQQESGAAGEDGRSASGAIEWLEVEQRFHACPEPQKHQAGGQRPKETSGQFEEDGPVAQSRQSGDKRVVVSIGSVHKNSVGQSPDHDVGTHL